MLSEDNTHFILQPRLGYLCPSQVDKESEPFVRLAQEAAASEMSERQRNKLFPPFVDYSDQQEAIKEFDESQEQLRAGVYVLLDLPTKQAMIKSFDL